MLSWLFASPWMLAWLPLAAAPVLIHLWYRRKYRQITWAAMEYLLAAIARSSRRMRIEQLLLLLMRIAVVVLAVMALAEPLMRSGAARLITGARTHHVLVLDGSYSMQYKPDDKTLFEAARERAREIVDSASEGDAFTLLLMAETPRVVIGHAAFDHGAVAREMESLTCTDSGANVPAALEAAERLVQAVRKQNAQLSRHHVHFLTDLQRGSWTAEGRAADAEGQFLKRAERLSTDGSLEIVSLGSGGVDNLAVERLTALDTFATTAQPVRVQAVVRNFGQQARSGQVVELLADGQTVDQQTVDIPANEATPPLSFSHRFESPGDHVLSVRAAGDKLTVDNQRFLALNVKQYLRALCISGKRDSTRFLMWALDPYLDEKPSLIRPQVAAESALMDMDLKQFDCIFLCNVGQFTASEARVLQSYLKNGGGLVFFLGDQVRADNYNRELAGQTPGSPRVLPAMLGETKYREKFFFFDPLGYRHPLTQVWKGNPQTGLVTAPVAKYFQLKVPKESRAQVALAFDSGDPAIVEEPIGRGRAIVVATAASTESIADRESGRTWTPMVGHPGGVFPALVQRLWSLAVGGQIAQHNSEVGQPLGGLLPPLKKGVDPTVVMPGGQEKPLTVDEADSGRWAFADTDASGIYTVNIPGDNGAAQKFAVNFNAREGDLARVSLDDLPRPFVQEGAARSTGSSTTLIAPPAFPLFRILLCAVLALMIAESIVAWWLGNRSA